MDQFQQEFFEMFQGLELGKEGKALRSVVIQGFQADKNYKKSLAEAQSKYYDYLDIGLHSR